MAVGLPKNPRILDIGAGPGANSLALARSSAGKVTAVDRHQPFLDELERRARETGLAEQITTLNASMSRLPFEEGSFDLIWSEGAIYMIGFRQGLTYWRRFLSPNGYIAVTEPCWLKKEIPDEARRNWAEYPAMTTIEDTRRIIADCRMRELGSFVLPESSWWDEYYFPMEVKLKTLRSKYASQPNAITQIEEAQLEIDIYRKYPEVFGYVFFVMQLSD